MLPMVFTRLLDQLSKSFPSDVAYNVPFESVSVVKVSISEVVKTLLEALALVVLVVFIFLQDWRSTIIPVLAIPVSIIGTFIFFIPLGFTINKLTLFGFVLAIGIVVDDAIIVVEAVQRYMEEQHLPPKEAAHKAMADISGPVVAIALVLAAVFVPAGFLPGIVGRLYQQFAITIAISVLISAFVALSLTPALCSLFLKPHHISQSSKGLNYLFFHFNKWFNRRTEGYTNNVRTAIKHSRYIVILLVMIVFGAYVMIIKKPTGFIPLEDEGRLYITFELPEALVIGPRAATRRHMSGIEVLLIRHAHAGRRGGNHDDLRPLSARGGGQAAEIAARYGGVPLAHAATSPYVRCVETLEPLAAAAGTDVEVARPGSVRATVPSPRSTLDRGGDRAPRDCAPTATSSVRCSCCSTASGVPSTATPMQKGSIWRLTVVDGAVVGGRYEPPPTLSRARSDNRPGSRSPRSPA